MIPRYLAIALGPGNQYGLVIPYANTRYIDAVRDYELLSRVNILYDGNSFDDATTKISKLKDLNELMRELAQIGFL